MQQDYSAPGKTYGFFMLGFEVEYVNGKANVAEIWIRLDMLSE